MTRLKKVQGKKKENKEKLELERKKQAQVQETDGPIEVNNILKDYEDDEDVIFR